MPLWIDEVDDSLDRPGKRDAAAQESEQHDVREEGGEVGDLEGKRMP